MRRKRLCAAAAGRDAGQRLRKSEERFGSVAANPTHVNLLVVHLVVGFLVAALAILLVWQRPGRRITIYVVTLQIVIGVVLMVQGLRVPSIHPALAVLGWAGYMAANAIGRRPEKGRLALIVTAVSSLLILIAFGIGQQAARVAGGSP
jgi:CHASE2 domain-containing sensor protein